MKSTRNLLPVVAVICLAAVTAPALAQATDEISYLQLTDLTNSSGAVARGTSDDGRRIVFESANNYTGENADSNSEIFLYDHDSRTFIQVTKTQNVKDPADSAKVLINISNTAPAISGDGTRVVFLSNAALTTPNDDGNQEVYVALLPRAAAAATFVRVTDTGKNFPDEFITEIFTNYQPAIGGDGTVVSFVSTRRVFNALANGTAAFAATAENAGSPSDPVTDGNGEIFLYSLGARAYTQVTLTRDQDATVNFVVKGFNSIPQLSGNGRVLVFLSGFNYPGANANKNTDFNGEIFLYEMGAPTNTLTQVTDTTDIALVPVPVLDQFGQPTGQFTVSLDAPMNLLTGFTRPLSRDGGLLTFESGGDFGGLNPGRTREVWVYNTASKAFTRVTNQTASAIPTQEELRRIDYGFVPSLNAAGTYVTFVSTLNLTSGNADGSKEIYLYDVAGSTSESPKLRQLTTTQPSILFTDQRSNQYFSYPDNTGSRTTFATVSGTIGANLSIANEIFQAVIRPVTETNAQAPSLANAASFDGAQVARGSIAAAFGTNLARGTAQAASVNLPFELGGVTVTVGGFAARLIFVAPGQINFVMPQGIADGDMIDFSVNNNGVQSAAKAKVVGASPGVFTATSDGVGAAAAQCGVVMGSSFVITAPPCAASTESEQRFLILYGTGWRLSGTANVTLRVGDQALTVNYAGPQGDFPGLDQINAVIPAALMGKGEQDTVVTASSQASKTVKVTIQ